ncbi:MAG: peptide ABC transporter substrate-binding protein, partial [Akkermansiaceae bacterium]|nr:peptide ABC transporter substrate-binding protein [Akkermansiaceae bacterium]
APFSGWTKPGNIVSNGPFQLKSWRINDHIEVEKNPHYWDAETVKLNGVRFLPVINSYTESRMFFDGLMHITYT